jgi:hypothetical protein
MTGGQLTQDMVDAARRLGWWAVHYRPGQGRRPGHWATQMIGDAGMFDVLAVRSPDVVFAEAKREVGDELTPEQERFKRALDGCPNVHAIVVRPSTFEDFVRFLAYTEARPGRVDPSRFGTTGGTAP